jgi:uncharacterized protein YdhG (YjbR/CyaY superfamily)
MATRKKQLLSDEEKAALKETLAERKGKGLGEEAVLAKIAEMEKPDRVMAERIHKIVKANAPHLTPKTWYGMPAYADRNDKVVCFFQAGSKFKARYATLGFQPDAHLDDGSMWATSFALTRLTAKDEAKIAALVKKASR